MSVYSHQAYRNYTKGSVLKFCSILIMDWLCTQQIEKIVCIEVCSFQLCSSLNYFCSGPIHAFLLFRAIIRAHFLLIWLQQHSWNCDKHLLAPNPESEYNNAPNSCFSFPYNLIWLPMLESIKFPSLLCFSFQIWDILLTCHMARLCSKGCHWCWLVAVLKQVAI